MYQEAPAGTPDLGSFCARVLAPNPLGPRTSISPDLEPIPDPCQYKVTSNYAPFWVSC